MAQHYQDPNTGTYQDPYATPQGMPPQAPRPAGRGKSVVVALVAGIAVGLAVVAALVLLPGLGNKAPQRYQILAAVSVPGLDAEGSRIPVHVEGTTTSGEALAEDTYVDYTGTGLELPSGTYTLTANASPISSTGTIYHHEEVQVPIEVPADLPSEEVVEPEDPIEMPPYEPGEAIPEEVIDRARDYMQADPEIEEPVKNTLVSTVQDVINTNSLIEQNIANACEFATYFWANYLPPDSSGNDPEVLEFDEWKTRCLQHVAPNSEMESFLFYLSMDDYWEMRSDPFPYQMMAAVYISNIEVLSASETEVTLLVTEHWTQEAWSYAHDNPREHTIYFDEDSKIVGTIDDFVSWPDGTLQF